MAREKLKQRGIELPTAAPCIYARSFLAFLRDCVWTIDEARGGEIRAWPFEGEWERYWLDWEHALLTAEGPLLVDKTRRTMASNVVTAFDLWVLAGGTDPRWPTLERSQSNRRVLIQAQKLEGVGGSAEFVDRIRRLLDVAEQKGLRAKWPGFPTFAFSFGRARASNGSQIDAVPQGAEQVRGPGTTLLHAEELAFWEQARASMENALPALHPYGKLIAVTTPQVGGYAADIRNGELRAAGGATEAALPTPGAKLPFRRTKDGWCVLEIRGERDVPGYDPREVGRGMSEQTYRREVLGDWTASAGKVVYPEYGDIHEPLDGLPYDPERPLLCGWDLPAATGGTPAFVASQLSAAGQWLIYGSVQPLADESLGVWDFALRVYEWLHERFAAPTMQRVEEMALVHYGDPAGAQKALRGGSQAGIELRSAYDIIHRGDQIEGPNGSVVEREGFGWVIQPGEVSLTKRLESVRARLSMNVLGGPGLLVAPSATMLREGFRGGYHYAQRADGRYELDPAKNKYSHSQDSLGYVASRVFLQRVTKDPMRDYLDAVRRSTPATRTMGGGRGGGRR